MLWGTNLFLIKPWTVNIDKLINFISRVPDDEQLVTFLVSFQNAHIVNNFRKTLKKFLQLMQMTRKHWGKEGKIQHKMEDASNIKHYDIWDDDYESDFYVEIMDISNTVAFPLRLLILYIVHSHWKMINC